VRLICAIVVVYLRS